MRPLAHLSSLALLAASATAGFWLSNSESGLQTVAELAMQASAGRLQITQSSGRLSGPLAIAHLRWASPGLKIAIDGLRLDWQPGSLLHGKLTISELSADNLRLDSASSSDITPAPSELRLPLAVDIEKVAIFSFNWNGLLTASALGGRLSSDGLHHQLSDLKASSGHIALSGTASLNGMAPLPLSFSARLDGMLDEHPLQLIIDGHGPLERIALAVKAEQGVSGQARATLTPFAAQSFADAQLELSGIDPAAWFSGAPHAALSVQAHLQPKGDGLVGDFSITNPQAGPLDRQRLPLQHLSGKLNGDGNAMHFEQVHASLSPGSSLSGSGQWQKNELTLTLQATGLDAAALVSRLRPSRLGGSLTATLSSDRQTLHSKLSDPRFALKINAQQAAGTVTLATLELAAGDSLLKAAGELKLKQALAFNLAGELSRFDPSRFIKAPAALINSRFKAQGKLQPQAQLDAHFEISNSRLAGAALTGHGDIRLDWPHLSHADISLSAGSNHLQAKGAHGQAGDALTITIDAPQLAPYGIDGDLSAQLRLAGTAQAPTLSAHAEAKRLRLPGTAQLNGLKLTAEAGGTAHSPLQFDLAIARIDTPEQPARARALHIQASGSNSRHRILGSSEVGSQHQLALSLQGGLDGRQWRGELQEAQISGGRQNLKLSAPAALSLGADGWSLGPAQVAGNDEFNNWQASVQASADRQHLRASLKAHGARLGELSGQLEAGVHSPWSLNAQAPWLANLSSRIDDLGWVAELLGERWKSGGNLRGELKIAGTPAQPVANGQLRGENLVLRLPEQGLHLAHGELDIALSDNLLRVKKLSFDSLLQAPPRALLRSEKTNLAALVERPGKLEISGEMLVDRNKGADRAVLDFKLERLGVYQLPDQWVVVSGDGRLNWQNDTIGIRGKLAADAGYWQLAKTGTPTLSDDVVIKAPNDETPASNLRPKLDLDVSANLGKNFLFNGAGLSSRLSGDIRLRASGHDLPKASGSIRSRDGRFEAYGQQLSIERGILTFQGLIDNPALDIRALRKGQSVEAGVQVSGTAQRPSIRLISDPELPDAEKLAWLILGHGSEQMGAGDATLLLSAASSILGYDSGGVVKQLKNTFRIDEFGIRQGQISDSGSRSQGSRVAGSSIDSSAASGNQILSVGKRLSSNALLSYEQTLGKAESIVKLTVNLTRQISLIGRAGSDNALDIFYTITFGRASPANPVAP